MHTPTKIHNAKNTTQRKGEQEQEQEQGEQEDEKTRRIVLSYRAVATPTHAKLFAVTGFDSKTVLLVRVSHSQTANAGRIT
jgi:hypothetical protein